MPLGNRIANPGLPMRGARIGTAALTVAIASVAAFAALAAPPPASAAPAAHATSPNLVSGSAYLVAPGNLIDGHYYESFPPYADYGLTIDGAFALAATGDQNAALRKIVSFLDSAGKDKSGKTINSWTGIGTSYASGGAIGKEALLAEVVGDNPRDFGGHNLIAALDALTCAKRHGTRCPAPGAYSYDSSVFDQALGVMAQIRAGQARQAAAPIAYLEHLQNANGSYSSLIPPSGGPDVDSTAMAVMALALVPGAKAAAAVSTGLAWISSAQERDGGFPGAGGDSTNSAGLAIQALTLDAARYQPEINAALAFLASEQNANGGFDVDAGQHGSNVRASTQALGGAVGTSFGTLHRNLNKPAASHSSGSGTSHGNAAKTGSSDGKGNGVAAALVAVGLLVGVVAVVVAFVFFLRYRYRRRSAQDYAQLTSQGGGGPKHAGPPARAPRTRL